MASNSDCTVRAVSPVSEKQLALIVVGLAKVTYVVCDNENAAEELIDGAWPMVRYGWFDGKREQARPSLVEVPLLNAMETVKCIK